MLLHIRGREILHKSNKNNPRRIHLGAAPQSIPLPSSNSPPKPKSILGPPITPPLVALAPTQRAYDLTGERRERFLQLLKPPPVGKRDTLRIGCTAWSEYSCVAAGRFLILFSEAGWSLDSKTVSRLEPSIPIEGIAVVGHDTQEEADAAKKLPPHLGIWHLMDDSQKTIHSAFTSMGIPVSWSADLNMPIGTIGVYFGSEPEKK